MTRMKRIITDRENPRKYAQSALSVVLCLPHKITQKTYCYGFEERDCKSADCSMQRFCASSSDISRKEMVSPGFF